MLQFLYISVWRRCFISQNKDQWSYLSQEAVHKDLFELTEAVHSVYAL